MRAQIGSRTVTRRSVTILFSCLYTYNSSLIKNYCTFKSQLLGSIFCCTDSQWACDQSCCFLTTSMTWLGCEVNSHLWSSGWWAFPILPTCWTVSRSVPTVTSASFISLFLFSCCQLVNHDGCSSVDAALWSLWSELDNTSWKRRAKNSTFGMDG